MYETWHASPYNTTLILDFGENIVTMVKDTPLKLIHIHWLGKITGKTGNLALAILIDECPLTENMIS